MKYNYAKGTYLNLFIIQLTLSPALINITYLTTQNHIFISTIYPVQFTVPTLECTCMSTVSLNINDTIQSNPASKNINKANNLLKCVYVRSADK